MTPDLPLAANGRNGSWSPVISKVTLQQRDPDYDTIREHTKHAVLKIT